MEASSERTIGCDGFKFIAIDTDGTVRRLLGSNLSDPNPHEFNEGAKSKDVVVDTDTGVFVRMYLPDQQNSRKLPIFFYAHGGGFCIGSASSTPCHEYLCKVAKEIGVLCVSVDYRLCPEHRLPAAYDDCFGALRWLLAGPGKNDPWIADHGDLGRVFLAGESAGGNIVHELGIRAGRAEWGADVCFQGGVLIHPFFQEKLKAGEDSNEAVAFMIGRNEFMKELCLPAGEDVYEYPPFNPEGPRSPPLSELVFKRVLVAVAEKDNLRDVGILYHHSLCDAEKETVLFVTENEGHCFHIHRIHCPAADAFIARIRSFICQP